MTYPAGSKAALKPSKENKACLLGSWFYQSVLQIKTCFNVFSTKSRIKKIMFLLPGPWLHVHRELIDQVSVTCAPWREGPSSLCWAYMSTTHACSQADGVFYVLPTSDRSCSSYSVQSPDCQARDISAPMLLGHGMWCRDYTAFKTERFRASIA